ncbi:MAG: sulfite dehydrogenase [Acidobacteria bacterium]|jgi:sulfane dehydrogenase subunit SoxC|nr:sulfite dehydrogenase [Bryobacteraceae bacterium CoA2 C42]MCA2965205.1 sulfite dehydrogenase [Acidobacteriaceae bacterium]
MKAPRRKFLALSAALTASCKKAEVPSESGAHMRPYGERAPQEQSVRIIRELTKSPGTGSSRTPLHEIYGIITPSALHFERHHAGVPAIDPATHRLLIHGLVDRPLSFSLADLKSFPSLSRICFLECGGNSVGDYSGNHQPTVQGSHGLLSCSEWTGVKLSRVLAEVGVQPDAQWMIAEGADASMMTRSIPMEKVLHDAMLVYGQNGEALRPEQGYPLRLILPGWEGNTNVKWLRRLEFTREPAQSAKETANYTELLPNGQARQFSFVMDARSVITSPSGGMKLSRKGFHEITGFAWTGHGKIARVEVSVDNGQTWALAELQEPVLSLALVRFRFPWRWDGAETRIMSRCTDETGYVQPTHDELLSVYGPNAGYHYHAIRPWRVLPSGEVVSHV